MPIAPARPAGLAAPLLLLIALLAPSPRAEEPIPGLPDESSHRQASILSGGLEAPIAGGVGTQGEISAYRGLPADFQLGLRLRVDFGGAEHGYDYLPQTLLQARKLWVGDQDTSSVRNSEYFGVSLGGYFGYDFQGKRLGFLPMGAFSLGKYWMPFDNAPFGLDFSLELSRYFLGHLSSNTHVNFLGAGFNLFYSLP